MKNIAFVINNISTCGGLERATMQLSNLLDSTDKYNVTIISMFGNNKLYFEKNDAIKIKTIFPLSSKFKAFKAITNFTTVREKYLKLYLKKYNIDILIDVDTSISKFTNNICKQLDISHISWDHFNHKTYDLSKNRIKNFNANKNSGHHIVVLTKKDYEYYVENGYDKSNITVIPNYSSIEYDSPLSHNNTKKVISIGRYSWEKGFDLLLDAWKLVEQDVQDWTLDIYGPKYDKWDEVNTKKIDLGLKNVVLHTETKDVAKIYKEAEIYVCSSRLEGFSLVTLEACASALPIVSFNCPDGPREILENNDNAYLVDECDTFALGNKLISLINDEDKRKSFGKASFEISKKYSKENFLNSWLNLLESL